MGKSEVITTCDCGCGVTAKPYELGLWLTLSQQPERHRSESPKLGRNGDSSELQFASIDCLARWVKGAQKIIPAMMHSASGLHPRGEFYSSDFPTLWF